MSETSSSSARPAIRRVACIGTGTIGSGWAALGLARGLDVAAWDPAPGAEAALAASIDGAWPKLARLGLTDGASRERLVFAPSLADAVAGADFVQESAPDDEALKIGLLAEIDSACPRAAVIASSSSRFLPTRLASSCRHPERVIVGHPFVPAYLVPLVEVVGGERTLPGVMTAAAAFYTRLGKRPLLLKKEIEAYVANRLQHAVFEEALRLVAAGVCDYDDIDRAVTWGPGLRWAVVGPVLHRHLGGGKGGVRHMIEHFGWRGAPGTEQAFIDAVEARWGHVSIDALESWRDDNLIAMLEHLEPPP
ncbi:MAG: 3-hydroxyacyl-CoA dehydrogenase NAD-binding domain-containing protein [Gammaproteobacteria bacterium]|nr:3-hydroxyacyl-CoA dehydrogenase NAD-binding domain-containing protein [Gammaproteobacteria bacterium]